MRLYCLGFLFTETLDSVLLITKARPEWQAGLRDGIGGKLEDGEMYHDAMVREFKEETGATVNDWRPYFYLTGKDWTVVCFVSTGPVIGDIQSVTDEKVSWAQLPLQPWGHFVPNLHWLVPMAKDCIREYRDTGTTINAQIQYNDEP